VTDGFACGPEGGLSRDQTGVRFCGHKGQPNVIERFSTISSNEMDSSFISMGRHKARQRAYFISGLVPLNLVSSCRTNLRGRKPEVSHEASDHIRNCSHCRYRYCNHHAVVVLAFDRASCRRYSRRSVQEFPQPGRGKSVRAIALLNAKNTLRRGAPVRVLDRAAAA
jgi:hypothetical protein